MPVSQSHDYPTGTVRGVSMKNSSFSDVQKLVDAVEDSTVFERGERAGDELRIDLTVCEKRSPGR